MNSWANPYYEAEGVALYCGDCCELLAKVPNNAFDAIVTDPPYGVHWAYDSYDDTPENLAGLVARFMPLCQRVALRALITPGNLNHRLYPVPTWTLAWVESAGTGCGPWGFACWQPILAYGPDPYLACGLGSRPDTYIGKGAARSDRAHPCAKPLPFMRWLVERATPCAGEYVLDPFMGSGTTGVACVELGRQFVGIEQSEAYCEIAANRIEAARRGVSLPEFVQGQGSLFSLDAGQQTLKAVAV